MNTQIDLNKKYTSDVNGKSEFVEERLKPLILALGQGWTNVEYKFVPYSEKVVLTNANPDKTIEVNVSMDSILALTEDVMKRIF